MLLEQETEYMDFTKIRALVTDGGGRQTLTIIRGLKEIGSHVTVICKNKIDLCYSSRFPDKKIGKAHV